MKNRNPFMHPLVLQSGAAPYVSPFLLEILSTRVGAPPWVSATGSLLANTGQTVSCSRAASAYCMGDDGFLHLLGPNTVRVEPTIGMLRERAATNQLRGSITVGDATNWTANNAGATPKPVITLNTTDVLSPDGTNDASKLVFPAVASPNASYLTNAATTIGGFFSIYLRAPTGQTAQIYILDTGLSHTLLLNITDVWVRYSIPLVSGQVSLGSFQQTISGGTVYAWGAQCETGTYATSLIVTTTAAATRDTDIITCPNPLFGLNPTTFRAGITSQPTPGVLWGDINTPAGGFALLLGCGTAGVNAWYWMTGGGFGGGSQGAFFLDDAAGGRRTFIATSGFAPATRAVTIAQMLSAAGTMTSNLAGSQNFNGTGIVGTQAATLYLGSYSGVPANSAIQLNMKDIYVSAP